jgi:NTE family protein
MSLASRKIGLALSGGGYRATAFHLGTMKKLHELNILPKVDVISTISGGSITGAAWALSDQSYPEFHQSMESTLHTKGVIKRVIFSLTFLVAFILLVGLLVVAVWLSFQPAPWHKYSFLVIALWILLIIKFQFIIFPVSTLVEKAYNQIFFSGKKLGQFKPYPEFAIGSSNLHTGRPFTFSKEYMGDSMYADKSWFKPPIFFTSTAFPVARAVMASSCVPFAFTPVSVKPEFFKDKEDSKRVNPVLVDGGVYDNQGIHKITQPGSHFHCDIIITSDAGGGFLKNKKYSNTFSLLLRTVDLFMYRIKTAQMVQQVYDNTSSVNRPIAYFSLGWRLDNCIPGFYHNMVQGNITKEVLDHHFKDHPAWVADPKTYQNEIIAFLKKETDYETIKKRDLDDKDWEYARSTGTGLSRLPAKRISCLITQAENLTELQVKLYCPVLL